MIISRKRYEREMEMRKAEIDYLFKQMEKMHGEICRLQNVVGLHIQLCNQAGENVRAEAEHEV